MGAEHQTVAPKSQPLAWLRQHHCGCHSSCSRLPSPKGQEPCSLPRGPVASGRQVTASSSLCPPATSMWPLGWLPVVAQLVLLRFLVARAESPIRVFVVPHSHMDVGWLYTVQVGARSPPPGAPGAQLPSPCQIPGWV